MTKSSRFALPFAASIVLALTFTFSCSSDVDYGDIEIGPCSDGEVKIGTQTWQKCNLNVNPDTSKDTPIVCVNCNGKSYDWATAMNLPDSCNTRSCSDQIQSKHQGICQDGWHIPSKEEWDVLVNYAGGYSTAGKKLKATKGWYNDDFDRKSKSGNGTDEYGFAALPGGSTGYYGAWWSSSEGDTYSDGSSQDAYRLFMRNNYDGVHQAFYLKDRLRSIRCLKD